MSGQRETRVFTYPNMIVRVHFPDLSEEETERRKKQLYDAAEKMLKEVQRIEARKKNH